MDRLLWSVSGLRRSHTFWLRDCKERPPHTGCDPRMDHPSANAVGIRSLRRKGPLGRLLPTNKVHRFSASVCKPRFAAVDRRTECHKKGLLDTPWSRLDRSTRYLPPLAEVEPCTCRPSRSSLRRSRVQKHPLRYWNKTALRRVLGCMYRMFARCHLFRPWVTWYKARSRTAHCQNKASRPARCLWVLCTLCEPHRLACTRILTRVGHQHTFAATLRSLAIQVTQACSDIASKSCSWTQFRLHRWNIGACSLSVHRSTKRRPTLRKPPDHCCMQVRLALPAKRYAKHSRLHCPAGLATQQGCEGKQEHGAETAAC
jgi:hypothetical protein